MSQNPTQITTPETIALSPNQEEFTITCTKSGEKLGVIAIPAGSSAAIGRKDDICRAVQQASIGSDAPSSFNCSLEDGYSAEARLAFTTSVESIGNICIAVSAPEKPTDSGMAGGLLVGAALVAAAVAGLRSR